MNPIAIWFHARLSGPPVIPEHARAIMAEQFAYMGYCGLLEAANEIIVGCADCDRAEAEKIAPKKTIFVRLEEGSKSELPTLTHLRAWLPGNPHAYVLYQHIKCATRTDPLCQVWRRCMYHNLILQWHECVHRLNLGCDSVGAHWLTPEQHPGLVKSPFWGGNFWWAKASFLMTLPAIPNTATCREDFFIAESWIGTGPRRPRVFDFHHEWPNHPGCGTFRRVEFEQ